MKKLVIAAALAVAGTAAIAGGMDAPVMEAPVVVEAAEAASSAGGWLIPLILLALIIAAGGVV